MFVGFRSLDLQPPLSAGPTPWKNFVLPLIGIVLVVVGFVLRINPLLVVTVAGLATGMASGLDLLEVVAAFGKAFIDEPLRRDCLAGASGHRPPRATPV